MNFQNSFVKCVPNRIIFSKIKFFIYDWSDNRGYIDVFYVISLTYGIRGLVGLTQVFIDEKLMELPIGPVLQVFFFFVGEGIKYIGGGRISS